jgi:hypothetical protein
VNLISSGAVVVNETWQILTTVEPLKGTISVFPDPVKLNAAWLVQINPRSHVAPLKVNAKVRFAACTTPPAVLTAGAGSVLLKPSAWALLTPCGIRAPAEAATATPAISVRLTSWVPLGTIGKLLKKNCHPASL